jgi:hypothetical protein
MSLSALDHEQLGYTKQQLDLMMRQFPPLDIATLDLRLARIAEALGADAPYRTKVLRGTLVVVE